MLHEKEEAEKKTKSEEERERKVAFFEGQPSVNTGRISQKWANLHTRKVASDMKNYTIFVGSSNVPYNIVENLRFHDHSATLDNCYSTSSRTLIVKKVLIALEARIGTFLHEAKKYSRPVKDGFISVLSICK